MPFHVVIAVPYGDSIPLWGAREPQNLLVIQLALLKFLRSAPTAATKVAPLLGSCFELEFLYPFDFVLAVSS